MGVSAHTTASGMLIHARKEGSPVKYSSVAVVGSDFEQLEPSSLV